MWLVFSIVGYYICQFLYWLICDVVIGVCLIVSTIDSFAVEACSSSINLNYMPVVYSPSLYRVCKIAPTIY